MTIAELPELLNHARRSRDNVLAAKGILRTGAHEQWKAAWAADVTLSRNLINEIPSADESYENATHQELENKLLAVHALRLKATRIRDKYSGELASDGRDEERIRADARARLQRNASE